MKYKMEEEKIIGRIRFIVIVLAYFISSLFVYQQRIDLALIWFSVATLNLIMAIIELKTTNLLLKVDLMYYKQRTIKLLELIK